MTSIPSLLGSHLSELHSSKHIGYLNMLSKATPTISGYFHQQEANYSCLNHQYGVFQCSLYRLYCNRRHKGKVGSSRKVKATDKVSHWASLTYHMHSVEMETEQQVTVVRILYKVLYTQCPEVHFQTH